MEQEVVTDAAGFCPHCREEIVPEQRPTEKVEAPTGLYLIGVLVCPECETILGSTEVRRPPTKESEE